MDRRDVLVMASAGQLAASLLGHRVAVRQGRSFDIAFTRWRGRPERVARDSWLIGTGLSAPVVVLTAQAAATARLLTTRSPAAARALGLLGAAVSFGYLVEQEFRTAVTPTRLDPATTPAAAAGFGLAVIMAVAGLGGPRVLVAAGGRSA